MQEVKFEVEETSDPTIAPQPFQQTVAYIDYVIGDDSKPVVRIFGSTPAGQKSLLHLHECYPYLFCDIPLAIPPDEFVIEIKHQIERFLKGDKQRGRSRVFRTSVEPAKVPIYGYSEAVDVCKIELFDPADVRRSCEYLASKLIRVYNGNVGYLLQVMVDLDLAGMDLITCSKYCFRGPLPTASSYENISLRSKLGVMWTDTTALPKDYVVAVPRYEMVYDSWHSHAAHPARTSTCELEIDVVVGDVLIVRPEIPTGSLAAKRVKFVKSLASWWLAEEARRKTENISSEFDDDEESNHVDSGESYVDDPFLFRKRLARLAEKMVRQAKATGEATQPSATSSDFRRSQSQIERLRSPSLEFAIPEEALQTKNLSQETHELIQIIKKWQDDSAQTANEARCSPSQLTDEELLSQRSSPPPSSDKKSVKSVRFAASPVQIRSFDISNEASGLDQMDQDDEEDDEDEDEPGSMWEDILASQKDFVEEVGEQLDGGVFDDVDAFEEAQTTKTQPPDQPTTSSQPQPETDRTTMTTLRPPTPDSPIVSFVQSHHSSLLSCPKPPTPDFLSALEENAEYVSNFPRPPTPDSPGGCSNKRPDKVHATLFPSTGIAAQNAMRPPELTLTEDLMVSAAYQVAVQSTAEAPMKERTSMPQKPQTFLTPSQVPPSTGRALAFSNSSLIPRHNLRLHYSDPNDVPKRTADAFVNMHAPVPVGLLESLAPAFDDTSLKSPIWPKRTRWLEPVTEAPVPSQHKQTSASKNKQAQPNAVTSAEVQHIPIPYPTPALKVPALLSDTPPSVNSPTRGTSLGPSPSTKSGSPVRVGAVSQLSQASSLSHATPGNPVTGNQKKVSLRTALEKSPENNNLTILGFEVFAKNRSTAAGREGKGKPFALLPDPQYDPVIALFYCTRDDQRDHFEGEGRGSTDEFGFMYWSDGQMVGDVPNWFGADRSIKVHHYQDELALLRAFVQLVREVDPDVLMGWEMQKESLGYILQRAKLLGETQFPRELSRVPYGQQDRRHENDEWGNAEHSGFWIAGRHIFNLWRICREELKLTSYSVHNVLLQLIGEKLPKFSAGVLTGWWESHSTMHFVVKHFRQRTSALLKICDHLDVLGRNSELSRLFGMDLFSVLTRGSQFRVEAVLLRVCKGLGYLMLSPTRDHVARQPAMEATPLIFEPESAFYSSPVLVMDFRSLYPSVIIANNICFSTCLGRLKPNVVGTSSDSSPNEETEETAFLSGLGVDAGYYPPLPLLSKRADYGFVSPNGVCFVSRKKREGILPRMLREILDTRVMIKSSVEGPDVEESKRRVADARQFGLKMIANVTYGYTAASFSGRMPCAEIADAIVQTGRACLELAVKIVHDKSAPWAPAECVYGDTDSLFVHLPGRDLEQARKIGRQITERVSHALPKPMKLQFEKVFFPCVLEVKKRYVGWKFSSKAPPAGTAETGTLDAKGIETIRRDGCPAVVKLMEGTLKEIFTSRDLSRVKRWLRSEFEKMFAGTVSMSDFIITGKVKLGSYAKDRKGKGNYPPAAVVADKMLKRDPRAKPVYKERVAYVVACGPPGSRLIDLVVDPHELLVKSLRVNVAHYIYKLILPALDRLLACAGVDVKSWFQFEKTRNLWGGWRRRLNSSAASTGQIHHFFECAPCVLCAKPSVASSQSSLFHFGSTPSPVQQYLCFECAADLQRARYAADVVAHEAEKRAKTVLRTCADCVRGGKHSRSLGCPTVLAAGAGEMCLNLDCEVFYVRRRAVDRVIFDVTTLAKIGSDTN